MEDDWRCQSKFNDLNKVLFMNSIYWEVSAKSIYEQSGTKSKLDDHIVKVVNHEEQA